MTTEFQQRMSEAAIVMQREEEQRRQAEEQRQQQDLAQREAELRQQSETAERMSKLQDEQTARGLALVQQTNPQEFARTQQALQQESVKAINRAEIVKAQRDVERQIANVERLSNNPNYVVDTAALDRAKASVEENRRVVEAITSKELAPFVKFTKDGGYIVNVYSALKMGVDKETLIEAGISKTKVENEAERIKNGKGPSETFVTPEEAKKQSQLSTIIYRYEKRQQINAIKKISDYIDKDTKSLDVEAAVSNGVSLKTIQQAGYDLSKKQYDNVITYQKAQGEDRFNLLVRDGVIPRGSIYAGTDDQGNPTYYTKEQKAVMDKLEKYDYNLALMLKKDIVTENELLEVGIENTDIIDAKNQVKASSETGVALEGEAKYLRDWYKDFEKAEIDLNKKIAQLEKAHPNYSKSQINDLALRSPEYERIQELNSQLKPLETELGVAARGTITAASFIFPPVKAGKPEYTMSDVTALDWGIGVANAALFIVPFAVPATTAGRAIVTGTQVAAGGIYTADTVKNWESMSNTQRGISVAIDTLLLASAVLPYAGNIARATNKGVNAIKNNLNNTITKSEDMISHLFKKAPVNTPGTSAVKQLTEGGVIGPWANYTDTQLIQAVAKGNKPLAWIEGTSPEAIKALSKVKDLNLKVKYFSREIPPGTYEMEVLVNGKSKILTFTDTEKQIIKNYLVFKDNPTGRLAANKFINALSIDKTTPEGLIKYHTQIGESLGYRQQDIRLFFDKWAATDTYVKEAWNNLKYAMALKDKTLLKQATARLQLAAAELPKQISDPLMRRLKLMSANTDDWMSLVEKAPDNPGNVSKGIDANKQFIDNAERQLRKVSSAKRREEIEKALEEARKQIKKTQVQTKVRDPLQKVMTPEEMDKYLPAVLKETEKTIEVAKKPIPVTEFSISTLPQISKKYKVSREALIEKVSSMPVGDRVVIVSRNIPGLSDKERLKILPAIIPGISTPNVTSTEIQPQTVTKTSTKIDLKTGKVTTEKQKPVTALQPETGIKPEVEPKIGTGTTTTLKTPPKISIEPVLRPDKDFKQETPTETQTKVKKTQGSSKKKGKKWSEDDIKSAIAWKDGFVIHAIRHPYRRGIDETTFHVNEIPPGLTITTIRGKGSEQATINVTKGRLKRTLTVDVGNQDKIIRPVSGGRKAIITSRLDRGGITKSNLTISKQPKSPSKKRGRQYYTKIGGGTVISRRPLRG